jgi:hypothetical protein
MFALFDDPVGKFRAVRGAVFCLDADVDADADAPPPPLDFHRDPPDSILCSK